MPIDLFLKADLISAAKHAPKPVAFLLGSPLSIDRHGGVPGIDAILELVRDEIRTRAVDELPRFETEMADKSGAGAYQTAMRWLQGNFTQDAVNHVVERAVLKSRRAGAPEQFPDIGEIEDWYVPAGTRQVGELVTRQRERFPGPILTTNFDPLFSVAVEQARGHAYWHILDLDGHFGRTAGLRRGDTQVIHLHGFWRCADTLISAINDISANADPEIVAARLRDLVKGWNRQSSDTVSKASPNPYGATRGAVTVKGGQSGQRSTWVDGQSFDRNGGTLNVDAKGLLDFLQERRCESV